MQHAEFSRKRISSKALPIDWRNCDCDFSILSHKGVKDLLGTSFSENCILSHHLVHAWPPRSPDLKPCDYWFRGYLRLTITNPPTKKTNFGSYKKTRQQEEEKEKRDTRFQLNTSLKTLRLHLLLH
ncbi:hypothetical protein TNCV_904871 [Trichonephila clavipes]|nr:hypothetical protein TNCV_904871 [Trichonephila clavipes]